MSAFRVFRSTEEWTRSLGEARPRTTVTVGNFDGLHLGHQKLLRSAVDNAKKSETLAVAVTFDPHPFHVLRPDSAPPLISTLAARLAGFQQLGISAALVMQFDRHLSQLSAENFVRSILVDALRVQALCVGQNFRFGHRHAGDVKLLRKLGAETGFEVRIVPPVTVRGTLVSSTAIRGAILAGRVDFAARFLGRPYVLAGQIQSGEGNGRRLLVPTLNLGTEQGLLPHAGVYATETVVSGRKYPSATNVGHRPTLNGTHLTIESHLFGFSAEVKSGPIEVHFWRRLRDEKKFPSVEALRGQIQRDLRRAESFFRRLAAAEAKGLPDAVRREVPQD